MFVSSVAGLVCIYENVVRGFRKKSKMCVLTPTVLTKESSYDC